MILPANHLFKVIQGATFDFRFQYLLGPQPSVTPVDLAPYSPLWIITSLDQTQTYFEFAGTGTPGSSGVFFGGDTDDPTNGIIDLILTSNDTDTLGPGSAAYYFAMVRGEIITPLITGFINVMPGIIYFTYPDNTLYPDNNLYPG